MSEPTQREPQLVQVGRRAFRWPDDWRSVSDAITELRESGESHTLNAGRETSERADEALRSLGIS